MLRYLITSVLLFSGISSVLFGQKKTEETYIIATANRKVPAAHRITEAPKIIDTILVQSEVQYPLLSLKHHTEISLDTIQAASIRLENKLPQLYNTYVKLGIGSYLMPLGEVYYNNTRSRKFIYGASVKHLSAFGKIKNYAPASFDRTSFDIFGGIREKKYSVDGNFLVNSRGLHWYGIQDKNLSKDSIRNRFTEIGTNFSFTSHAKDSAHLNYKVGVSYLNFHDKKPAADSLSKWNGRENNFAVRSTFWYKLNKEVFALDFNVLYNGYRYGVENKSIAIYDSGRVVNNTIVTLRPNITTYAFGNKLKAQVGVDLSLDAGIKTKFYIYPVAEVKYSLFNDILIPYAGIKGGLKQNTFKSMSLENEFILSNVELKNEHNAISFFAGIKGTLTKTIGFDASISFGNYKNKLLFVTDTLITDRRNQFRAIYDAMNITTIQGSIFYQMNEKIKVDLIGRFNSYNARNNIYAWNLPALQIIARGSYNLYDKFLIHLDMNFEGGRKAKVYEAGEGILEENQQFAQKLGFIADVNLGVEYRYNKRISAFLQLNNVAAQKYKRWYNYPVHTFQVLGGLTFRF